MGRMDVGMMRYLQGEHFRVLVAVEMGMKNHEIVPLPLISSIAGIHRGAVARVLSDLCKHSLVAYERSKKFDGYRLTVLGYDYLALKALCTRNVVGSVGNKIGVGKESDVFVGGDPDRNDLCLKFHRLGRTSFRRVKEKRDYHNKRRAASWLYLSRLAAAKEFAFLKALSDRGFPVPRPVDVCRHLVVMGLVDGKTLCHVDHLQDPGTLYDRLMSLIVKLGRHGLIHGDFNEFNLMLLEDERVVMIDFPQMVSMDHPNARFYFERDIECIRTYFKRKFDYSCDEFPKFEEVGRKYCMDVELEASGFTRQMAVDLNKFPAYDDGNFRVHCGDGENEDDGNEGNAQYVEIDDSDSQSSQSVISEEDDDIDEDELSHAAVYQKNKARALGKSAMFTTWLNTASEQLEQLILEQDSECPLLVYPRDVHREEELSEERDKYIRAREEADREDAERSVQITSSAEDQKIHGNVHRIRTGAESVVSTKSTIPPEEIKRRVALEKLRNKEKIKLRVKGKQSAVRRGRKENRQTLAEYAGWI